MPRAVIRIRPEPAYRREAFESGLRRIGYTIQSGREAEHWRPESRADLLVLWNRKQGIDELHAEVWESNGGTVLVVENAYLQKVDKTMYAISTHQHNGAGWFPTDPAGHRFSALGFDLKDPVNRPEGYLLVMGQRGIGSKLMASPANWGEKQMSGLIGQRAKLRPHPGNFKPKVSLEQDLAGARSVRIWSSGAGVRALVEGLPVSYCAPAWICAGVHDGDVFTREEVLNHMAHGQWTVEEIASGEPFARMQAAKWGPKLWR